MSVRRRGHRAVLADVARLAGVSLSTASKILNDVASVSVRPATRRRVLEAAAELDYQPHVTARALAGGSSRALAFLVPELTNPVHSRIIRGAFAEARAAGYTVMVAEDFEGQEADASFGRLVAAGHVDGLLIGSARRDHPLLGTLAGQGVPHVFVNRPLAGSGRNVTMDYAGASALAVRHLAELGHRAVGHVAGPRGLEGSHTRAVAFRARCRLLGIAPAPVSHGAFDERGGAEAAVRLLRRHPELTALYASSLSQAVGVVHAVQARGLAIPGDVSVVAYDDLPLADYLWPAVDTIAMPVVELGRTAARALIEQIAGAEPADLQVPIPPRLVRRGSCAAPRG